MTGLIGFFLNPWAFAFAAIFAGLPIIIHLINRMQFRRVRWAAMEFLLAAQKRMRRKLIIEQLLLLLLRITVLLLVGLLFARWLMRDSPPELPEDIVLHEVLLDDSASMGDRQAGGGEIGNCFAMAKNKIIVLAKSSNAGKIPARLRLRRESDPDKILFDEQITNDSIDDLQIILNGLRLKAVRLDPGESLLIARKALLEELPEEKCRKILHFFSDFRKIDWEDGRMAELIADRTLGNIIWRLHDCAGPDRIDLSPPSSHSNLAIISLGSESRLVLEGQPLDCWAKILNFGDKVRGAFMSVEIDGKKDPAASRQLELIPVGQVVEIKFRVFPTKSKPLASVSTSQPTVSISGTTGTEQKIDIARRSGSSPMIVRVKIEDEMGEGLTDDDQRDIILTVRDRVPLLVVEGAGKSDGTISTDGLYFGAALNPQIFDVVFCEAETVGNMDFGSFAAIAMLNVGELSDSVVKNLELFVNQGGSLAWFAGDRTEPAFVNNLFERNGLFPILLAGQPSPALTERQRDEAKADDSPKIIIPDSGHSMVGGLIPFRPVFRHLKMERHWPSRDSSRWSDQVQVILALPSRSWQVIGQRELFKREILEAVSFDKEPFNLPRFSRIIPLMGAQIASVKSRVATGGQFDVVKSLEELLKFSLPPGFRLVNGPQNDNIWAWPDFSDRFNKITELIRRIQQGDPLLVSRNVGKGRVLAFLSSAGPSLSRSLPPGEPSGGWNEWANGFLSATYPILMQDAIFHLLRQDFDSLSQEFGFDFFDNIEGLSNPEVISASFFPQTEQEKDVDEKKNQLGIRVIPRIMPSSDGVGDARLMLASQESPGSLLFSIRPFLSSSLLLQNGIAFNVNVVESDLVRASMEILDPFDFSDKKEWFRVVVPTSETSEIEKVADTSMHDIAEGFWIFLFLIFTLLAEQALALRASHLTPHRIKGTLVGVR